MELLEALEAEKFAGQRAAANTEDSQISLPPRPLHPVSPESDSRPDSLRFPTEAQAGARRAAQSPADESSASSQAGTTTLSLRGVVGWFKSLLAPGRAPEPSNQGAESSEGSWSRDGSGPRRRRRRRVLYRGQDAGES
jgi:hypothetical protein